MTDDIEWRMQNSFRGRILLNGSRESGFLMRRVVNGEEQWRLPSNEELLEYQQMMAW